MQFAEINFNIGWIVYGELIVGSDFIKMVATLNGV